MMDREPGEPDGPKLCGPHCPLCGLRGHFYPDHDVFIPPAGHTMVVDTGQERAFQVCPMTVFLPT